MGVGVVAPETLPPFQSDLTGWFDASKAATLFQEVSSPATPSVAASGDVVGTWKDRTAHAYDMAAPANGNRGSLVLLNSKPRVRLLSANSHRYTNASIPINSRASAVFVVGRNFGSANAQALVHFPASGTSTFALYNNNAVQITNDPVFVYDGGTHDSGLKFGFRGSLETSFMMGGASAAYVGLGRELYTKGSAWSAGSATGGNIGYWNGTFPANYEFAEVLVYGRELSLTEKSQVVAYLEAKWPTVAAAETRFICATGDSITEGNTSPNNGDINSYLVQLLALYSAPPKAVNGGIGGQTLTSNTAATREVAALAGNSAYASRLIISMFGTNDIGSSGRTDTQVNADFDTYFGSIRTGDAGAKILALGITPVSTFNGTQNGYVASVNAHLASLVGSTVDYYLDLAGADARLSDPTNTTYYIDGRHPTVLGNSIIASLIKAKLATVGWAP